MIATRFLAGLLLTMIAWSSIAAMPPLVPGYEVRFPRDEGAHSDFQTEWWYVTGWVSDDTGRQRGFQITFFRVRNADADPNPSRFAARQLLFAHAALSDPAERRLLRAERSARAGFGVAEAASTHLEVSLDDWSLRAVEDGYALRSSSPEFAFDLHLATTQAPILHGERGYSRKSAEAQAASYYYSVPQLRVLGSVTARGQKLAVSGTAWMDHEWSNAYVDPKAVGWDWVGLNLHDGSALMAFRMRTAQGAAHWSSGTFRDSVERQHPLPSIEWEPLDFWTSPRTGTRYPVAWRLRFGTQVYTLRPLMEDQENDARGSVGILYWEGAIEARDGDGNTIGRGYLELTGYDAAVRL